MTDWTSQLPETLAIEPLSRPPLATLPTAFIARLTRASTLDILRQDYVRTAWAKGLTERLVVIKHILKNSLIPVLRTIAVDARRRV